MFMMDSTRVHLIKQSIDAKNSQFIKIWFYGEQV